MVEKKRVLFICAHNSARSLMAEGFLKALYPDRYEAYSAGTEPSNVNLFAVRVMQEIGIEISHHHAKGVSEFLDKEIDYVVRVCDHARQTCPFFPGSRKALAGLCRNHEVTQNGMEITREKSIKPDQTHAITGLYYRKVD